MLALRLEGLTQLREALQDFSQRRFNAAVATAMTRTAIKVRDDLRVEMRQKLDRPTPYTINALKYIGATAQRPASAVGFDIAAITDVAGRVLEFQQVDTPASKYMQYNIEGTPRTLKRLEVALRAAGALPSGWFIVPGQGATIDAYGNVSRGQITQVLSQLRIQLVAGSTRNMPFDAGKQTAAQRRAGGRFFVIKPGARVQPGIYQRELIGKNIAPVFVFVRRTTYRKRFDFYGTARKLGDSYLSAEFETAIEQSLERLRAKR